MISESKFFNLPKSQFVIGIIHYLCQRKMQEMKKYERKIQSPPEALVSNGRFNFGCYNAAIPKLNMLDAHRPYKFPLPRFGKNIQLREWQAFQITNGEVFVFVAIYNTKKMALVQFILYDIETKQKIKFERKPLPTQFKMPNTLFGGESSYISKDCSLWANSQLQNNNITLNARIDATQSTPNIRAEFVGFHNGITPEPTVNCLPFAENRAMYSHKCLMPVEGFADIGGRKLRFDPKNSLMILDDHKGYYPSPTRYDWVTGLGMFKGKRMGFNLTDNQVLNKEVYNENCLWHGDKAYPLPPIKVQRPEGYKQQWFVKDEYDMVDLVFTPVVHTAVNVNLLIAKSEYQGPYGFFNGSITTNDGKKFVLENMFGMGEDFYLRI